jgi:hypothetical protein
MGGDPGWTVGERSKVDRESHRLGAVSKVDRHQMEPESLVSRLSRPPCSLVSRARPVGSRTHRMAR